eukprot:EG_transcript_28061
MKRGENAILLGNHQTEADAAFIPLLLESYNRNLGEMVSPFLCEPGFCELPTWGLVPYRQLFRKFGFATNLSALPTTLRHIAGLKRRVLAQREKVVAGLRHYFLPKMVLRQIFSFIAEQPSDLRCTKLPKTPKGTPCP